MSAREDSRAFDNKTKDELEAGAYIVYADEPDTVVDGSEDESED